jgi:HAD superfamily hydrolase (TIGR01509 family)
VDRTATQVVREPLDLDALAARWWVAYEAAERGLQGAGQPLLALETTERARRLAQQHARAAELLQDLSRELGRVCLLVQWLGAHRFTRKMLGLPLEVTTCVFDLDGVLTTSARVHAAAWADTFDSFLAEHGGPGRHEFVPFDRRREYELLIAGRPRLDGVRAFLASRGIDLPEGGPGDPPAVESVHGLANRKNERLQHHLDLEGVAAFAGSRSYLEAARMFGLHRAVVSPSANTAVILERAGLADLIEQRIDGGTIDAEHLRIKPDPDTLLRACERLHVEPRESAAFEVSPTGVAAARAADFKLVIGVDRDGRAAALRESGADLVTTDLSELLLRNL